MYVGLIAVNEARLFHASDLNSIANLGKRGKVFRGFQGGTGHVLPAFEYLGHNVT